MNQGIANDEALLLQKVAKARGLIAAKRFEEAARLNKDLLAEAAEHPAVLIQASRLAALMGHYRRARQFALEAWRHRPADNAGLVRLLNRLLVFRLNEELLALVAEAEARVEPDLVLFNELARALSLVLGQSQRALGLLERVLARHPDHPELLLSRAQALTFEGRFDEAEVDLQRCIRLRPDEASAWWQLSRLRKQTPASNHVRELEARFGQLQRYDPTGASMLAYALHKELDDLGEYDRATTALEQACRIRRRQLAYDPVADERIFATLESLSTSGGQGFRGEAVPVFIIGLHRSGTTLLEQLLAASPEIRALGELMDFPIHARLATDHATSVVIDETLAARLGSADTAAMGRGYLQSLACLLDGRRVFTDKLPSNYYFVGSICQALPEARIVNLVRDPMEVCFSNLREFFTDTVNLHSYDQAEMGRHYLAYTRLMAHWRRSFPDRILDVSYSRLVSDTESVMREVAVFCGIDFVPGMLSPAEGPTSTASAVQVRQRIERREKPKWLPYADYLVPLAATLGRDSR